MKTGGHLSGRPFLSSFDTGVFGSKRMSLAVASFASVVRPDKTEQLSEFQRNHSSHTGSPLRFALRSIETTFTNAGNNDVELEVLDGLAKIEASGGKLDWILENMGQTLEGWMCVYHADDTLSTPFYKMSTEPSDEAKVKIEEHGHYCLSFIESTTEAAKLLPVVFDKDKVFGKSTSLQHPAGLEGSSVTEILDNPQYGDAKTSSSFAAMRSWMMQLHKKSAMHGIWRRKKSTSS
jgi:hypothetical protein